jgi:hypothetical protein
MRSKGRVRREVVNCRPPPIRVLQLLGDDIVGEKGSKSRLERTSEELLAFGELTHRQTRVREHITGLDFKPGRNRPLLRLPLSSSRSEVACTCGDAST